jgi:hypothetical protein
MENSICADGIWMAQGWISRVAFSTGRASYGHLRKVKLGAMSALGQKLTLSRSAFMSA